MAECRRGRTAGPARSGCASSTAKSPRRSFATWSAIRFETSRPPTQFKRLIKRLKQPCEVMNRWCCRRESPTKDLRSGAVARAEGASTVPLSATATVLVSAQRARTGSRRRAQCGAHELQASRQAAGSLAQYAQLAPPLDLSQMSLAWGRRALVLCGTLSIATGNEQQSFGWTPPPPPCSDTDLTRLRHGAHSPPSTGHQRRGPKDGQPYKPTPFPEAPPTRSVFHKSTSPDNGVALLSVNAASERPPPNGLARSRCRRPLTQSRAPAKSSPVEIRLVR